MAELNRKEQITAADAFCVSMMDYLVTVPKNWEEIKSIPKPGFLQRAQEVIKSP